MATRENLEIRINEILLSIGDNPNITAEQLSQYHCISVRQVRREIKTLVKAGLIRHVGSNKTGYWQLVR
ncbi:MAG: HTH domain-containing protein [Candidatus Cloacimonetes bacterium]|nr:HTH domain-containing protein [Candidatus Cloacimonadota bacterium]